MTKIARVGVSVALYKDLRFRQIYLISREKPPKKGLLCFPGGGLQYGETLQQGMARQLREETGFQGRPVSQYFVTQRFQPDYHYVILTKIFIAQRRVPSYQSMPQKWFQVDDVIAMNHTQIIEGVQSIVAQVRSGKFGNIAFKNL